MWLTHKAEVGPSILQQLRGNHSSGNTKHAGIEFQNKMEETAPHKQQIKPEDADRAVYTTRIFSVKRKRVVWAVLMGGCQSYVST